jgi:SHS2 domain-containing protein
MKPFTFFEHTADVGIMAQGKTLGELFSNSATALFDFITDLNSVENRVSRKVELECYDREELLVRWLSELLYIHEASHLLLAHFDITFIRGGHLRAEVAGEPYQEGKHQIFNLVKAVTYHQIRIAREHGVWTSRIILDV